MKKSVILVFAESQNDAYAIRELVMALRPDAPPIHYRRRPPVSIKGRQAVGAASAARRIAQAVKAEAVARTVVAVIAHEDCDAVEPADSTLAQEIETRLATEGTPQPIGVTPAWEMEAWWFMWPDAVAAVCSRWRPLNRIGQNTGMIANAKEALIRDLRPAPPAKAPDYEESHAPKIAENIRKMGIVTAKKAVSSSFERFEDKIKKARL
jgi:hypothetical protein